MRTEEDMKWWSNSFQEQISTNSFKFNQIITWIKSNFISRKGKLKPVDLSLPRFSSPFHWAHYLLLSRNLGLEPALLTSQSQFIQRLSGSRRTFAESSRDQLWLLLSLWDLVSFLRVTNYNEGSQQHEKVRRAMGSRIRGGR